MNYYEENVQDLLEKLKKMRTRPVNRNVGNCCIYGDVILDYKFTKDKIEITYTNNVVEKYEITKQEAMTGCKRNLKYKKLNRFGEEIDTEAEFEIPAGTKTGDKIVLEGKGNNLKGNKRSDLIIGIQVVE